jgi:hypothetical protein
LKSFEGMEQSHRDREEADEGFDELERSQGF